MRRGWIGNSIIVAILVASTLAVYAKVTDCQFILEFDDGLYVARNAQVKAGLTVDGIRWAFGRYNESNWIPVTWISLMIDSSLFGNEAAPFHRTNVVLHVMNTLLLFGLLAYCTGSRWRSGVVAALFAVHPMHVESVAWIAERKDVLSTLFAFGALWGYVWYCKRPGVFRYAAFAVLFAVGLMAKSMLVSLPVLMLLLDVWPLRRTMKQPWRRLLIEKAPLFAMSAAICVVTVLAQNAYGAIQSLHLYPPGVRLANSAVSAVHYLWKMVWPVDLAFLYPHPGATLPVSAVVGCAVLILAFAAGAILMRHRRPYVLMGWLWYIITLLPVAGIVQVGSQAMADRYTYVPYVGIFLAIVWRIYDAASRVKWGTAVAATAAIAVVVVLAVVANQQVNHWYDDYTLCNHALAVTTDNAEAHITLANRCIADGRLDEAMVHLEEVLEIDPQHRLVWGHIGQIYVMEYRYDRAEPALRMALRVYPKNTWARLNYGLMLREQGKIDEAIGQFREILRYRPDCEPAREELELSEAMR